MVIYNRYKGKVLYILRTAIHPQTSKQLRIFIRGNLNTSTLIQHLAVFKTIRSDRIHKTFWCYAQKRTVIDRPCSKILSSCSKTSSWILVTLPNPKKMAAMYIYLHILLQKNSTICGEKRRDSKNFMFLFSRLCYVERKSFHSSKMKCRIFNSNIRLRSPGPKKLIYITFVYIYIVVVFFIVTVVVYLGLAQKRF